MVPWSLPGPGLSLAAAPVPDLPLFSLSSPARMIGLYDQDGVLRIAGRDRDDCLAYAEFFGLEAGSFCLEVLQGELGDAQLAAA